MVDEGQGIMEPKPAEYKVGDLVHYLNYGKDAIGIVTAVRNQKDLPPLVRVQWWKWPGHPDITQAWSWYEPDKSICHMDELV